MLLYLGSLIQEFEFYQNMLNSTLQPKPFQIHFFCTHGLMIRVPTALENIIEIQICFKIQEKSLNLMKSSWNL